MNTAPNPSPPTAMPEAAAPVQGRFNSVCLKTVRWSSWPLLVVIAGFLLTGYAITGQLGGFDEAKALAWHKWMHLPLLILLAIHVIPAFYLALRRWGWIKIRR